MTSRLKDFQRDTVRYVTERFFGDDPIRRFLIADETGMGKSVVAGGIVAEVIDRHLADDTVKRADIVYICSNQDIARQNLDHLKPPGRAVQSAASRLTLLGLELPRIRAKETGSKPVTIVSFTPGTSFDTGWRTGKAEERALIYHLLRHHLLGNEHWDRWRERAAFRILQCTSKTPESFENECLRLIGREVDRAVLRAFRTRARADKLVHRFRLLLETIGRRQNLTDTERQRSWALVADLRGALAAAGVEALQPALVILDEFQRFRGLLDRDRGGDAAELAHHLFEHPRTRLLMLSATPYKPFTYAEETADDHHADLHTMLQFLNPDPTWNEAVTNGLAGYREALLATTATDTIRAEIRRLLLQVMCRTERPPLADMLSQHIAPAVGLDSAEIRSWVAMKRLGVELGAPVTIDYWKSVPYFLNFVEGYLLGQHLQQNLRKAPGRRLRELLRPARLLDPETIDAYTPIDLGNGRLRELARQTVGQDWWKLLWLPPSMPYHRLGEPFATAFEQGITKRLIFSSWQATPTAVSALLSYDAECRIRQDRREPPRPRLDYRSTGGRPANMSTLALFWPHPGLAAHCDPQRYARTVPDQLMSLDEIEEACRAHLREQAPDDLHAPGYTGDRQPWRWALRWPSSQPEPPIPADSIVSTMHFVDSQESPVALSDHIRLALVTATDDREPVCATVDETLGDLAAIGMHAPGNIAWRALDRLIGENDAVSPAGLWLAAATLADGLRTLFNRPESMLLLDKLNLGGPYWQDVLRYCAAGGLQAVLDEYLHVVRSSRPADPLDDESLWELARGAEKAITLHAAPYSAFNPLSPGSRIPITGRFALRYGGRTGDSEATSERTNNIRNAFNSPFWPFVVTTTSAGQEGIDFHRYCSAVVHWNVPANPVDFEQREGRVHRFGGHAVRRNVADKHRGDALRATDRDIWKSAYHAARRTSEIGDMMPYWLYPGPASIERHVLPLPLSRDCGRYEQLQRDLALYRLTFGQPRQEDLVALLADRLASYDTGVIDLRPPRG